MTTDRAPLRADAARNRAAILRAARESVIARGAGVEMDEIARVAGVAVGTLYRHFPTKSELTAAVTAELGAEIVAGLDEAVVTAQVPGAGAGELAALLRRVVVEPGKERLLRQLAPAPGACLPAEVNTRVEAVVERLVDVARRDGSLRPDVTAGDVFLLLASSPGLDVPEAARERWVQLAVRSITP